MSEIQVGKVGMIPLESITIGERARQEMGDLDSLETDMKGSGLISPLAVKDNKDGTYLLLAGERRFTVLKKNNIQQIPVRIYEQDLSPLEMKIIEKSENFHRKDMEYYEFDALTLEIHQMKQQLHGVKAPGPGDGWSMKDTGETLGVTDASVSMAVKRAEAREAFPELFDKCKTASDASKVIKKVDEAIVKQTIAQKLETQRSDGTLQQLSKCFILKDFFEGVKEIPDEVMHLVEIDPPYAIDIKKKKKSDGESQYALEDYNEIDIEKYQVFISKVFQECYRVMATHSWLICWFAPEPWFEVIYRELNNAGFNTSRMCGIWTKPSGQTMQPDIYLANSYEMFFYAWKGRPALNKAGRKNIFEFSPVSPSQKTHPTERPIDLTTEIYDTFAFQGSRVLIPFLGSGNGLISAQQLGMSPVGFELGKGYKDSFLVKVHLMK